MDEQIKKKLRSYLSLAQKAGKLVSGEELCEKALKSGGAALTLVCTDASDNTKKKFKQKAFYYTCLYCEIFTKQEMSEATGRNNRSSYIVTDSGFAGSMTALISELKEVTLQKP